MKPRIGRSMALASLAAALCAATLLAGPCGAADSASARAQGAARTATHAAEGRVAVVYHLSEGIDQAARALGNIRNHLAADPTVHIVVVGLGGGIDFMLSGAHDAHGNPFDVTIEDLARQGVEFRACNNTLHARGIDPARLVPEAQVVPAGVAEIARLQAREGFAYIRP